MQFFSAVMCGKQVEVLEDHADLAAHPAQMARRRPARAGRCARMWVSGSPSTQMTPPSMRSSVISMRSTVVLPEPDGPIIATFSPRAIERSSPSITVRLP